MYLGSRYYVRFAHGSRGRDECWDFEFSVKSAFDCVFSNSSEVRLATSSKGSIDDYPNHEYALEAVLSRDTYSYERVRVSICAGLPVIISM